MPPYRVYEPLINKSSNNKELDGIVKRITDLKRV